MIYEYYYTPADLRAIIASGPPSRGASQDTTDPTWYGTKSFEQAVDLATVTGLPDVARKYDEQARKVILAMKREAPQIEGFFDVCGAVVDIGRFLENEPECMIDYRLNERPTRVLNVAINAAALAMVSPQAIVERGSLMFCIMRALELSNYSIGVSVSWPCENHSDDVCHTELHLKCAGEYLDPAVLAFYITHPASLRRIGFRLKESLPDDLRRRFEFSSGGFGGYSRTCQIPQQARKDRICIPPIDTAWSGMNFDQKIESIVKHFRAEQVDINGAVLKQAMGW